jgi:hypothetical protein
MVTTILQLLLGILPEISCFPGNDYIERIWGNGVATVFTSGAWHKNVAVIDSFVNKTTSEKEWLKTLEKATEIAHKSPNEWTADRFTQMRNLIKHYPVFQALSHWSHSIYMVFENKRGGEYVASPCSFCSCESGALFFCICYASYIT